MTGKQQPQRTGQEDRGITAAAETYQHGKGEIMDGLTAKNEDGQDGKN